MEFSLNPDETNYRQLNDKEIILIFIQDSAFVANEINIINRLKPILVQYSEALNQFISIENSLPIIPFINAYVHPGWNVFDLLNINYRENYLNCIKQYGNEFINNRASN